jgi:type II secretory pathway pseudopilin PulG
MRSRRKKSGQEGYVLLALMLAVTLILIALSIEAPRIAQQIKRDKEEELVHRGMDYATAIKRFVHKSGGRYPLSVEQLEDTNHIRFLRKRYKDPMTGEDNWRLVHVGEAEIKIPPPPAGTLQTTNPGLGGTSPGQAGAPPTQPTGSNNASTLTQPFQSGGPGAGGQVGSLNTSNIGNGTSQPVGGGQIIGVASISKKQSIKEFNDKDHYNDWFFVYDLRLEQAGGRGIAVASPRAGASGDNATGQPGQGQQPAGTGTPGAPPPNGTPAPTPSPVPN